jgi:hypothetical protein
LCYATPFGTTGKGYSGNVLIFSVLLAPSLYKKEPLKLPFNLQEDLIVSVSSYLYPSSKKYQKKLTLSRGW